MNILENSTDFLHISIAVAILLLTIFICWAMYYFIVALRNFARITTSAREKMEIVDKILNLVKDKLEKGSNHMAVLADSAIKLVGFLMEKQKSSTKKKKP